MKEKSIYISMFLLLAGGITNYSSLHIIVSATLIGFSVIFFDIKYITETKNMIFSRTSLAFAFIISSILIYHLVRISSLYQVSRLLVFIPILFTSLFVIPQIIHQNAFLHILTLISVLIVILGLPAEIVGTFEIGPLIIRHHSGGIASIVGNSNGLGMIAVIGAITAYSTYIATDSDQIRLFIFIFIVINVTGVILSDSRLAAGLLVIGTLYFITGYSINPKAQTIIILGGFFSALMFPLIAITQLPGSDLARSVLEWNRVEIWAATIQAIGDQPLLGYGFGKGPEALLPYFGSNGNLIPSSAHNGYMSFTLWTGIIGISIFISYIFILFRLLFWNKNIDPGISALFGVFLIRMAFESTSFIGMGFSPLVLQLTFGYIGVQSVKGINSRLALRNRAFFDQSVTRR